MEMAISMEIEFPYYFQLGIFIIILFIWHLLAVNRRKSWLCLGNSSVAKTYIIRPKQGPVAKNATPRPSGWESKPSSGLPDQCSTTELQKPLPTTWARVQLGSILFP